ncbi:hypothetical protein [Agromyces sp. NPDC056965]|uniref:hypothetical protein n=1 Tax=Agromyces sp. NPDC056965 TaxID=3345983 RepID=UPI00363323CC
MPRSTPLASPSASSWLRHPAAAALRLGGGGLVLLALGMMWASRIIFPGDTYVSGLGAASEITSVAFNVSLAMVALGGAASAIGLWGLRSGRGLFGAVAVSTSLLAASAMFGVGAAVPCSTGCPIPLTPGAAPQDLVHTTAAVLGFALAGVAIIQTLRFGRVYAALAVPCLVLVIAAASAGGILSLVGVATGLGGWLELIATTSALLWLTVVSLTTQHRITTASLLRRSMADSQTPAASRPIGWTGGAPHLHLLG